MRSYLVFTSGNLVCCSPASGSGHLRRADRHSVVAHMPQPVMGQTPAGPTRRADIAQRRPTSGGGQAPVAGVCCPERLGTESAGEGAGGIFGAGQMTGCAPRNPNGQREWEPRQGAVSVVWRLECRLTTHWRGES